MALPERGGWRMLVRVAQSRCCHLVLLGLRGDLRWGFFFSPTLVFKTIKVKGVHTLLLYFLRSAVVLLKSQYQTDYLLSVCSCKLLCITSLCGLSLLPILFRFACGNHSDPNLSLLLVPV